MTIYILIAAPFTIPVIAQSIFTVAVYGKFKKKKVSKLCKFSSKQSDQDLYFFFEYLGAESTVL